MPACAPCRHTESASIGIAPPCPGTRGSCGVCRGHIEARPFADASFDVITANMVVEHIERPARMFGDVHRVLRDNGVFLIQTPNVWGHTTALARLLPRRLVAPLAKWLLNRDREDVYPTFYRAYSKITLETLASSVDLATEAFVVVHSSPQLIRFPPAMLLEVLAMCALDRMGRDHSRACIVASFLKIRAGGALAEAV